MYHIKSISNYIVPIALLQRIMKDSFRTEKMEDTPCKVKWEDLDERRKDSLFKTINYEMKAYGLHSPTATFLNTRTREYYNARRAYLKICKDKGKRQERRKLGKLHMENFVSIIYFYQIK